MTTNKPTQSERRSGTINLRVGEVQKEAITSTVGYANDSAEPTLCERAAAIQGKSRTEFILDAAYTEATSFLLDRKFFLVDDATFEAFERQLEAAPDPLQLKALKALLERPAPWD
jgi:uncharacterized protein (DUF1778 family)